MANEAVKKSSEENGAAPPRSEAGERAGGCGGGEEEGAGAKGAPQAAAKPAHHARRPMNAFLIFCKRHRTVVRKCYPNLENRAITKILGDWWSQLDNTEKESYIQLAQQYKEAFLKAFPDFKWYKLPAPPLRTLVTRPSNHSKPHKLECHLTCGPIVPGKLADESQMGRLSTLILSSTSTTTTTTASQSVAGSPPASPTTCVASPPAVPKPPKKRYLQGLFDAACAGELTPPDPAAEGQELASPPEKHISDWNGQQFTFGNLPSSMMSSHCPNFTTLPLTALHSPRDDASDHSPCTPQGASCGGGTRTVSSIVWSSNTDSPATGTAPGGSETTFHTSKQVIIDFVVDKLVNKEPCFQVRSSYISTSSGSSVITSESFTATSDRDSLAEELLSSDTRRCGVTSALQFESAPSVVSLPSLTGVPGSFVPPHTTTRRDSVVNSFCSQPVSYVTAPSNGTEIVTWAQDINVSRIVASLTNNNFYINKGKNGSLAVENIDGSPSSDCGLADCIPNNSSEHPFSVECPEASETSSGPFLINYKVFDAASLKTGCENALISFTGYSSEDCVVTSGCDDSKTISCLPFSKEPKLPQSDLSVKFSSNRLEAETCDEDGEKNLSVPVKIVHVDEAIKCPITSGEHDGKESTVYSNNLCSSSCGDSRQVQISTTATMADKCSDEDTTVKTKPANTYESSVVKMFPLKEHLRRYKAEQNCGDDSETVLTSAAIVSQSRLLPFPNASTEPCPKQTAPCFLSSLEHASQVGVQTNHSAASRERAPATSGANVAAYSFKSSTSSKKSEDLANVGGKPALLPQRQTSVRACKGQRYKQFMKETSRGVNKRARKAVLGTVEGGTVIPSPKKETHHQQACREVAGEVSADLRRPWDAAPAEEAPAALPWHAPLPGSPRRERLDSASSCCSSERTFSACSEGSLDALPPTCAVSAPLASVAGCSSFSQATSPIEKKKRKFSESLLQQDLATDGATKRDCETFDFNLDEKIGALPPLSLEDFQIKKKNRKRRCFAILKTSTTTSGPVPETAASHSTMYTVTATVPGSTPSVTWEGTAVVPDPVPGEHPLIKHPEAEDLVGSQKRKARRNSIRRLDADRTEGERVGADLWIGLLLLADAATSRSKMVVPGCSRGTDASVISHAPTSLS